MMFACDILFCIFPIFLCESTSLVDCYLFSELQPNNQGEQKTAFVQSNLPLPSKMSSGLLTRVYVRHHLHFGLTKQLYNLVIC